MPGQNARTAKRTDTASGISALIKQCIEHLEAIVDSASATAAERGAARRALEHLSAKRGRPIPGTPKGRATLLAGLIAASKPVIDRVAANPRLARRAARLAEVAQRAERLLAAERRAAAAPGRPAPKPPASKGKPPVRRGGDRRARDMAGDNDGDESDTTVSRGGAVKRASPTKPTARKAAAKKLAAKKPEPKKKAAPRPLATRKSAARKPMPKMAAPAPKKKNGGGGAGRGRSPGAAKAMPAPAVATPATPGAKPAKPRTRGSDTLRASLTAPPKAARRGPPVAAAPPPEAIEAVAPQPEPVFLGVSAPRAVKPGASFTARFVAYIKAVESKVQQRLESLARGNADVLLGFEPDQSARWKVGTPITVRLSGEHFTADPATALFTWSGSENLVSFVVRAAADAPEGFATLVFEAYIEGIRVAMVPVDVEIAARPSAGQQKVEALPARTAFASYASRDRVRVMDKLSALSGYDKDLDIFTDCLDMKPGESWRTRLEGEIPNRELFLLFWSRNARESKWVEWEWRKALEARGLPAIQPMPLEAPSVAPPPSELSSLHFQDIYLIVREAEEARQKAAPNA